MLVHRASVLSLASTAIGTSVSPVEKVIQLLEDLKSEVVAEGTNEATTYDAFACFCKTTTEEKSTSVTGGQDNIESLSADIAAKTATREEKIDEVQTRKKKQEELAVTLKETQVRLAKERAEYEVTNADLSKAISSLENAIAAMDKSKPSSVSFLAVNADVKKSLELAQVLNLVKTPKARMVSAFLQTKVDPDDPEYKYHSQEIVDVMNDLKNDFNSESKQVNEEWSKTETAENALILDLDGQMSANSDSIGTLKRDVSSLASEISEAREDLVGAEVLMKDDQLYLKDLTQRCEQRAGAYDQRSAMRADEIKALTQALTLLTDRVKGADESANERAFIQEHAPVVAIAGSKSLSFLQTARGEVKNLLGRSTEQTVSVEVRKDNALATLRAEGKRLSSTTLLSLALKVQGDPFVKVKQLIQSLIERLLAESTGEATKKGFCDMELSKAEKNRNHRWADVQRLSAELASLESKQDSLEEELSELSENLKDLTVTLKDATGLRGESKEENLATLKDAKEGLAAISEALLVLKVFYKQAAKAEVLLQASPVDENDPGAESGAYKGSQQKSNAIFGLLEVIKSDFERTIKNTSAQEQKEAAEFVQFDRTSKADIGGKETKTELDEQDLETTKTTIREKTKDMRTNMDLLDKALHEINDLKPMCIDSGMTFEERVQKREEEIAALKTALCQLDTDGVEPDCQ